MSGSISSHALGHPFVMSSFSLKPWIHSPISTNTFPLGFVPWKVPYRDNINSLSYPSVFQLSLPNGKQARKMRRNDENEIQIVNFLSLSLWHDYPLLCPLMSAHRLVRHSVYPCSLLLPLLHHFSGSWLSPCFVRPQGSSNNNRGLLLITLNTILPLESSFFPVSTFVKPS